MGVHSGQEPVTELHGTTEDVFLRTGDPAGLDVAHAGNDMMGILRERKEVGLILRQEMVLKGLPGLS